LNTKSENNNNKHVGGITMMHWQQTYVQNPSLEVCIYKVMCNYNVTWYNIPYLFYCKM